MRLIHLTAILALTACSRSGAASPLTQNDWTNGLQACSANKLSFRDGQIAYYPAGQPPLVMYKIVSMSPAKDDPSVTEVVVAPTDSVIAQAQRDGLNNAASLRPLMGFKVSGKHLALAYMRHAPGDPAYAPGASAQYFDLVACPR